MSAVNDIDFFKLFLQNYQNNLDLKKFIQRIPISQPTYKQTIRLINELYILMQEIANKTSNNDLVTSIDSMRWPLNGLLTLVRIIPLPNAIIFSYLDSLLSEMIKSTASLYAFQQFYSTLPTTDTTLQLYYVERFTVDIVTNILSIVARFDTIILQEASLHSIQFSPPGDITNTNRNNLRCNRIALEKIALKASNPTTNLTCNSICNSRANPISNSTSIKTSKTNTTTTPTLTSLGNPFAENFLGTLVANLTTLSIFLATYGNNFINDFIPAINHQVGLLVKLLPLVNMLPTDLSTSASMGASMGASAILGNSGGKLAMLVQNVEILTNQFRLMAKCC